MVRLVCVGGDDGVRWGRVVVVEVAVVAGAERDGTRGVAFVWAASGPAEGSLGLGAGQPWGDSGVDPGVDLLPRRLSIVELIRRHVRLSTSRKFQILFRRNFFLIRS